jgi:DNA-directed RNA polymerase subunit RPC12/RpoP
MIPPLVRRCPDCGLVGLSRNFATVDDGGRRLVECPRCGHRFRTVDSAVLK